MIKPLATVARKIFAGTGRNLKQNQTQGRLPSAATNWEGEEEGRHREVEREKEEIEKGKWERRNSERERREGEKEKKERRD